ncbi:MAG: hypothetical protein HDR27_09085 [Lachnospiraceae bacterium]|nr:hypothetical protein [Lachnospiraceae bacterium]
MKFYDSRGNPIAYTQDGEYIYLSNGNPAAYISGNKVYGLNGHHLGWFENGWIRDKRGYCVFYADNVHSVRAVKPAKHVLPVKSVRHVLPVKSVKQVSLSNEVNNSSWSNLSNESFFRQ